MSIFLIFVALTLLLSIGKMNTMYIKGSKWSMQRRRRRANPFTVIILVVIIGAILFVNRLVVPTIPTLFGSTPTPTRPPESFITDAQGFETAGKYNLAIQAYNQAVLADPKNPSNFVALARLNAYTGNYKEAVKNAENALLLNPKNDTAMALRGWAYGLEGDNIQAVASLQDALALNKDNAAAYGYLAEVYVYMLQLGQGDLNTLDNAINASKTAIAMAPNALETHRGRGYVLEYTANYEEAVTEFEAAVAINPNVADLHLALGRNYRATQQFDKAITEFSKANALNPTDYMPELLISRTYAQNGDYAKAVQYGEAAVADAPTNAMLYGYLGLVYWKQQQYLDAIDALRLAVRGGTAKTGEVVEGLPLAYDRVGEFYYTYGLALAKVGQCGEALQIAQAVATGLRNDDVAVYNAQEVINTCERLAKEGKSDVPTPTPTINVVSSVTPQP
jgi:tetratricopeptide (TPR) repeat protein